MTICAKYFLGVFGVFLLLRAIDHSHIRGLHEHSVTSWLDAPYPYEGRE